MSVQFTNAAQLLTPSVSIPWSGKTTASMSFFFRHDGIASNAVLSGMVPLTRGSYQYILSNAVTVTPATTMMLVLNILLVSGTHLQYNLTFNIGTVYHVAIVVAPGNQVIFINGISAPLWNPTASPIVTYNGPITFGVPSVTNTGLQYTVERFGLCNDYALTPTDVVNIRDGISSFGTIATSGGASWIGYWTLTGTAGNTPAPGDPGLLNSYDATSNITSVSQPAGTVKYAAPLVYVPATTPTPFVLSSGQAIGITFGATSNASPQSLTAIYTMPTVSINGGSAVTLVNPWVTGNVAATKLNLPPGTQLAPTDSVSISAPSGWAMSSIGLVGPMSGTIANKTGKSNVGTDLLTKTFRPGWNNAHMICNPSVPYNMFWNWIKKMSPFQYVSASDSTGRPLSSTYATIWGYIYMMPLGFMTIDNSTLSVAGYWACIWDDTGNHATNPTTCSLGTDTPDLISVTRIPAMCNPGTPGSGGSQLGIIDVYQVTMLQSYMVPGSGSQRLTITYNVNNTNKTFNYANDWVIGPGTFTATPGVPVSVTRPADPWALDPIYQQWIANGIGSIRNCDGVWGYAAQTTIFQKEQMYVPASYQCGGAFANVFTYWNQARPWNPAVTPTCYTELFGTPYNATLSTAIADTTSTTITISNAATAPVITGQMLLMGSEKMRVISVSGILVTVERGACGTTPATHATGSIQVQNAWTIPQPWSTSLTGQVFELVTSGAPHNLPGLGLHEVNGTWATLTFSDASTWSGGGFLLLMPTGATTALAIFPGKQPVSTLTAPVSFGGNAVTGQGDPCTGAPYETICNVIANQAQCNAHINIPMNASNSLLYYLAQRAVAIIPAGRKIILEYVDEPWNFYFTFGWFFFPISEILWPSQPLGSGWEWYLYRGSQAQTIFTNVWIAAGRNPNELFWAVNTQTGADATGLLNWCNTTLGVPAKAQIAAIYTGMPQDSVSLSVHLADTDQQACDMYSLMLYYGMGGYPPYHLVTIPQMTTPLAAYNAATGQNVIFSIYEGGSGSASIQFSTTITAAILATDTVIPVASIVGLIPNINMCFMTQPSWQIATEWVRVTAITPGAGNAGTLTVTRGQYGTTAAGYASGSAIRTDYLERSQDVMADPGFYWVEQDTEALAQLHNAQQFNIYASALNASDTGSWYGIYHSPWQLPGYGMGAAGDLINRNTLARPGLPTSKAPNTNKVDHTRSVRGQAFLDWMAGQSGSGSTSTTRYFAAKRYQPPAGFALIGSRGLQTTSYSATVLTSPTWTRTPGSLIVVLVGQYALDVPVVTDTLNTGTNYAQGVIIPAGSQQLSCYWAVPPVSGAGFAVKATVPAGAGNHQLAMAILEFSFAAGYSITAESPQTGPINQFSSPMTLSAPIVPTGTDLMIFGCSCGGGTLGAMTDASTPPFTIAYQADKTGNAVVLSASYLLNQASSAAPKNLCTTSNFWCAVGLAFKAHP